MGLDYYFIEAAPFMAITNHHSSKIPPPTDPQATMQQYQWVCEGERLRAMNENNETPHNMQNCRLDDGSKYLKFSIINAEAPLMFLRFQLLVWKAHATIHTHIDVQLGTQNKSGMWPGRLRWI